MILILRAADETRFFPVLRPALSERYLHEKDLVQVQGCVSKKSEKDGRLTLELRDTIFNEALVSGERILAYLEEETLPHIPEIGEQVTVAGKINFYQEPRNPGNFNQKFYYQKQNIHAFIGRAEMMENDSAKSRTIGNCLEEALWKLKKKAGEIIENFMGLKHGGMLCAMLLGEKGLLEDDIRETMGKSGIGHLYAVSGLHVSFFGYGIYRLLRKMGLPIWSCAVTGSMLLLLYVQLTGSGVSARRACIMFLVRMGAEVSGRVYDGLTALAAAAILILVRQPLELWDAGFLLSFGAILGIYGVLPVLNRCLEGFRPGQITAGAMTALSVNLMILPVMLWFYFEYAFYSLVWNVAVILLAPVVMGTGLCGTVLGGAALYIEIFKDAAIVVFWVTDKVLWFYEAGSRFWLKLPGSRLVAGKPSMGQIILYYAVLFLVLLLLSRRTQKKGRQIKVKLTACAAVSLGLGILFWPHGKRGQTEVVMVDVGQGDCFFIRGPGRGTYLIDGGSSTVSQAGQYRIEPFLKSQGVGVLDYVFVSHGDADHMNGIEEMLLRQETGVEIKNLVLPSEAVWDDTLAKLAETASEAGTRVLVMEQDEALREEELTLTCLWPESGYTGEEGNQASVVLSLTFKGFDMLFTGDLEKEAESAMGVRLNEKQEESSLPKCYEVLKAGHHGSKNATAQTFLEITAPQDVFVSAGQGNSYGHPHKEVVERLAKWGCTLYNTKEQGAVRLLTDGKSYRINTAVTPLAGAQ